MKKLFALLLALMMVLPTALGEETAPQEVIMNWEQLTAIPGMESLIEQGTFATLERYGLSMWLPYGMQRSESDTYLYDLAMEDGSYRFMVREDPLPENITTIADMVEHLKTKADNGEVSVMRINDLPCFGVYLNEGDLGVIIFAIGDTAVQFFFPNQLDASMKTVYAAMIASIQDAEQ